MGVLLYLVFPGPFDFGVGGLLFGLFSGCLRWVHIFVLCLEGCSIGSYCFREIVF